MTKKKLVGAFLSYNKIILSEEFIGNLVRFLATIYNWEALSCTTPFLKLHLNLKLHPT